MNKQIECLARLLAANGSLDDIIDFLIEEKIMDASELPYYRREVSKPKYIWNLLNVAKQKESIMLLDYEWQVLPVERIKITVVTNRNSKNFTYNYV